MKLSAIFFFIAFCPFLYSCSHSNSKQGMIKLVRVERHPNSLEYGDKPFSKEELLIATEFLRKQGTKFFIDSSGQIFLPENENYGENIKTFMWVLSDDIADSMMKKNSFK